MKHRTLVHSTKTDSPEHWYSCSCGHVQPGTSKSKQIVRRMAITHRGSRKQVAA